MRAPLDPTVTPDDARVLGRVVGGYLEEHPGKLLSNTTLAELVEWAAAAWCPTCEDGECTKHVASKGRPGRRPHLWTSPAGNLCDAVRAAGMAIRCSKCGGTVETGDIRDHVCPLRAAADRNPKLLELHDKLRAVVARLPLRKGPRKCGGAPSRRRRPRRASACRGRP